MGGMTVPGRVSIAPLTLGDLGQAARLFEITIADAFEREGLSHLQSDMEQEIAGKKRLACACMEPDNTDIHFWVARIGGQVAGTISYAPCGEDIRILTDCELEHVGELGTLYVMPEYQGRGIASALIAEVEAFLRSRGVTRYCLDSGYKRAQAKWLQKFGEPYAMAKDHWGPGSDHLIWLCSVN
ncbi:GNAT family N-acetyltransferase [Paenibacillus sp. MMS20-IR301]|uniref:GNAT family N-acetyltransferase n=1 Tax=Paenibacillus sp. MMS20-IR301 TaxID=2895946 RepID=UPI0028ECEABE|nr:GNAT family N-acetyltransferase [Paenibacillus sp. MMS20-IR301]WNS45799.1 GNAT family N-acetyltransferase [Paenibacillus sp. MMS20-IR301]